MFDAVKICGLQADASAVAYPASVPTQRVTVKLVSASAIKSIAKIARTSHWLGARSAMGNNGIRAEGVGELMGRGTQSRLLAARTARESVLPGGVMPLGLSRAQVAEYIGVSPTTFDRLVKDGLMPQPKRIYGRTIWDIREIEAAFAALDSKDAGDDPWGGMAL